MVRGLEVKGPKVRRRDAGYSLTELLVVLGVMGLFLLIAVPNIIGAHERYLVRVSSGGVVAYLKLARMKAVANNRPYLAQLDPVAVIRDQCGAGVSGNRSVMVVRRDVTPEQAEECHGFERGIAIESVAVTPTADVAFQPNGTADAANWFLVRSRNRRLCQLVCVNVMGAVASNIVREESCISPNYGATTETPCPPPA